MSSPKTSKDATKSPEETAPSPKEVTTPGQPDVNASEEAPIEVDSSLSGNDADSSYESSDDMQSFTASLTSSIINYPTENGRRYHAYQEGRYVFPNDEIENARLDLQHHMLKIAMDDNLHYAPIGTNPQRILDVGTGTGDQYPSAQIIGNDLSPVQPTLVPPNVQFEVDDLESEWTHASPFDYIHSRYMIGSIEDWPRFIRNIFKTLKPGGWAEFQDFDVRFFSQDGTAENTDLCKWANMAYEAGEKLGRTVSPAVGLVDRVRAAGFTDIHHMKLKIPLGTWPKETKLKQVGAWNVLNILDGLEGWSLKLFIHGHGWSVEEIQVLLAKVRNDIKDPKIHSQQEFHIVYGRKPEASEDD
ncbi:MAG: hypothetical protein M1833_002924 [Piccolia ochrophora]|nr:MAG: hypothetical protein M1833_002924 [Piccolia ochrophora]